MSEYRFVVTDIEADNLLDKITTFHCATVMDFVTGEYKEYRPWQVEDYLRDLKESQVHVNHNIIGFDFPALEKLFGFKWKRKTCFDTLVVSRTIFPDRPGGHSLKSLSQGLDEQKGTLGGDVTDWSTFTEDMMAYNVQDCRTTRALAIKQLRQVGLTLEQVMGVS